MATLAHGVIVALSEFVADEPLPGSSSCVSALTRASILCRCRQTQSALGKAGERLHSRPISMTASQTPSESLTHGIGHSAAYYCNSLIAYESAVLAWSMLDIWFADGATETHRRRAKGKGAIMSFLKSVTALAGLVWITGFAPSAAAQLVVSDIVTFSSIFGGGVTF